MTADVPPLAVAARSALVGLVTLDLRNWLGVFGLVRPAAVTMGAMAPSSPRQSSRPLGEPRSPIVAWPG